MQSSDFKLLEHHNQLVEAIIVNENLPRSLKTLLSAIASFFNVNKQCAFPSRRQIALRTGYSRNHITGLIQQAVTHGFITSTAQFMLVEGENARRQISNKYEFTLSIFGLYFSKAKALSSRFQRNKSKKNTKETKQPPPQRAQHKKSPNQVFKEKITNFDFYFDENEPPE